MAIAVGVTAPSLAPADSGPVAKYEAADFAVTGGADQFLRKSGNNPRATSEGRLLVMYGTYGTGQPPQTASYTADTPAHADRIIVPVRGEPCVDAPPKATFGRWPHFTVAVDGTEVISTFATSLHWRKVGAKVNLPAGRHTFTITFDNDYWNPGVCDRNLRVDYLALFDVHGGGEPVPLPQLEWAPVGTPPLSDSAAAAQVTHQPEDRPENTDANNYVPSDSELAAFYGSRDPSGRTAVQFNPLTQYVTGRPGLTDPSTDDLIQWAAHKWGIPEDVVRAQIATESNWRQSTLGDRQTVPADWYALYPPQAQIIGTSDVYQSMGISQIKWTPDNSLHAGTDPLRWKSVAFNLDYYGASVRYYYDGLCSWCTAGYAPGQEWNSIGAWFNPQPWLNLGQLDYIQRVMGNLADRPWEDPSF